MIMVSWYNVYILYGSSHAYLVPHHMTVVTSHFFHVLLYLGTTTGERFLVT